jgi:hypothetical protein
MFNQVQDGKMQFKRWNLTTELLLEVVLVSDKLRTPLFLFLEKLLTERLR